MKRSVSFNIKPAVRLFSQSSHSSPTLSAIKEEEPVSPKPLAIGQNTAPDTVLHYDGRSWNYVKRSGCHAEETEWDQGGGFFSDRWGCGINTLVQPMPTGSTFTNIGPIASLNLGVSKDPLPPTPLNLGVSKDPLPPAPLNLGVSTESLRIKTPKLFPEQEPPPTPIFYDNSPLSPGAHHLIGLMREEEAAVRKEALALAAETSDT